MSIERGVDSLSERNRERSLSGPRVLAVEYEIIPALATLRVQNGLPQTQFKQLLGVSQSSISRLENPKADHLFRSILHYIKGLDKELGIALVVKDKSPRLLAVGEGIIPTIKAIRKELGLSVDNIAEMLGTSQSHISNLELKKRDPKLSTLFRYSTAVHPRLTIALIDSRA